MRLTTRVLDSAGRNVHYEIRENNIETLPGFEPQMSVRIYMRGGVRLGYMRYSIKKHHLYIHRLDNDTIHEKHPIKHVGSVLFEYAFNKSLEAKKGGRIELDAKIELDHAPSPVAYFKMGFRRKSFPGLMLNDLINDYSASGDARLKQAIISHKHYFSLKEEAAINLKKNIYDVTFEETINNGIYSSINIAFEKEIEKKGKLTVGDCYHLNMMGDMYLPSDIIQKKMRQFSLFSTTQDQLSYFREQAKQVKSPRLKAFVAAGKLTAANAIGIENKLIGGDTDPRLDHILSPIGLEMMDKNYISGREVLIDFDTEGTEVIISKNGLEAFEKGYIKHYGQLAGIGDRALCILTDAGLQRLANGELIITLPNRSGLTWIYDKHGNLVEGEMLFQLTDYKRKNLFEFTNNRSPLGSRFAFFPMQSDPLSSFHLRKAATIEKQLSSDSETLKLNH